MRSDAATKRVITKEFRVHVRTLHPVRVRQKNRLTNSRRTGLIVTRYENRPVHKGDPFYRRHRRRLHRRRKDIRILRRARARRRPIYIIVL